MIHAKRVYIKASAKGMDQLYDTGGKLSSIHRLHNNKIAEITRLQSKCKKKPKRWRRLQQARQYILFKSIKQLEGKLHKTTKEFIDCCFQESVSDV